MKIVTAGETYLDIDAYAGIVAYAELLRAQGFEAQAVSSAAFNESIPAIVRAWKTPLITTYTPDPADTFAIVDTSEAKYFAKFVDLERVETVIDHHPGHEAYWQTQLGDNAYIESVGAACTQVYELWDEEGLLDEMSETSARLLVCGILDNTLNFGAEITTDRDKAAYKELMRRAHLPENWPEVYFSACAGSVVADPPAALQNDTKTMHFSTFSEQMRVGQLAVWHAPDVVGQRAALSAHMTTENPYWFINVISIGEGKSYFVCDSPAVQVWLAELLDVTFTDGLAVAGRMWLRKEILKEDQSTPEL